MVRYLLGFGPVLLGEQLVLVAALSGTAETVDAVVGLLAREALDGDLDGLALLLEEVIESVGGCVVSMRLWMSGRFLLGLEKSDVTSG